jgi:hypothetical protein
MAGCGANQSGLVLQRKRGFCQLFWPLNNQDGEHLILAPLDEAVMSRLDRVSPYHQGRELGNRMVAAISTKPGC